MKHNLLVSAGVAAVVAAAVAAVVTTLLSIPTFPFGKPTPEPLPPSKPCIAGCMAKLDKCLLVCKEKFETSDPFDADEEGWFLCRFDCMDKALHCKEKC